MMGVFVQVNEGGRYANHRPIGYILTESGCWEWVGTKTSDGYGSWRHNGKSDVAHRVMYERHRGRIEPGLQIDHLCRNRACCNPDHLEVVSQTENIRRGVSPSAQEARRTHCRYGHPLIQYTGQRRCRECESNRQRRRTANKISARLTTQLDGGDE